MGKYERMMRTMTIDEAIQQTEIRLKDLRCLAERYEDKRALCNGFHEKITYLEIVLNALRDQQQSNEPLTLEELREMCGEPVYVVNGKSSWWDIVDFVAGGWLYLRVANKTGLAIDGYSNAWLAYRRKPEVLDDGT